uniref:Uncharacterized protein n=2 Tax=Mucochytrium quahogii TaxID=96639 RepID=A0A7S2WLP8_9STRA|mmetsp:Transcript_401/g.916  ORF Transcript_401/g.916 Transcript_401/m.916 type:complete len:358 (+) Transcript_401:448-1521(+)
MSHAAFIHEFVSFLTESTSFTKDMQDQLFLTPGIQELTHQTLDPSLPGLVFHFLKTLLTCLRFSGGPIFPVDNATLSEYDISFECQMQWDKTVLSKEETLLLLKNCRAQGTTLSGAICAGAADAFAAVLQRHHGTKDPVYINTVVTADTRRFYKPAVPKNVLTFHAAAINPIPIRSSGNGNSNEMWMDACYIKRCFEEGIRCNFVLWMVYISYFFQNLGQHMFSMQPRAILSNWGQSPVKEEYENGWEVTALTPILEFTQYRIPLMTVISHGGKLVLHTGGPVPALCSKSLSLYHSQLVSNLKKLCTSALPDTTAVPRETGGLAQVVWVLAACFCLLSVLLSKSFIFSFFLNERAYL